MSTKIKGAEYPLAKIFSSDFDYDIPSFQRPYAWTEEETGELFDDLFDFYENEGTDFGMVGRATDANGCNIRIMDATFA